MVNRKTQYSKIAKAENKTSTPQGEAQRVGGSWKPDADGGGGMALGASNRNRYLARVGLDGEGTVIRAQGIARCGVGCT